MDGLFVNYEEEQELFKALLDPESKQRILLFHGQSGVGKSHLLRHCLTQVPITIPKALIQFRRAATSVGDILNQMSRCVGWKSLPGFRDRLVELAGITPGEIDPKRPVAIAELFSQALQVENIADRTHRKNILTDSWFNDLDNLPDDFIFLLVLDSYERSPAEVGWWVENLLLRRTAEALQLRVVIAGQRIPSPANTVWRPYSVSHELSGIEDARAWLAVVEAMGLEKPSLEWLAGAIGIAKGNPSQILSFLQTLPSVELVRPEEIDRRRLRKDLTDVFDEAGLVEIAFTLNVRFEDLAGDNLESKAFSLIEYFERRGRLHELVEAVRNYRSNVVE